MAYLVLVRHGLTEYNEKGLWTGWADPPLTPEGLKEATYDGQHLRDIQFDYAYTAVFHRAKETLNAIKIAIGQTHIPSIENAALNERNYGDYTGKNKWDIEKMLGKVEFHKLRRGWNHPIPNGESLKQVYEREIPYFEAQIIPQLKQGKNIIIVSSGNALRALVKYLENLSDEQIADIEIGVGEAYVYILDEAGHTISKEIRAKNPMTGRI